MFHELKPHLSPHLHLPCTCTCPHTYPTPTLHHAPAIHTIPQPLHEIHTNTTGSFLPPQAHQSEILQRQEEFLERNSSKQRFNIQDTRSQRARSSWSKSPTRHPSNMCCRSRLPNTTKNLGFCTSMSNMDQNDKLPTCPICLGRHRHCTASCQATKTWSGNKAICSRAISGRIINKQGTVLCSDWQ